MKLLRMADLDLSGKRVLIREDFNVPIQRGTVSSDMRLRAALPTLRLALEQGARVILLSHLGRPQEGRFDPAFSLSPVAAKLGELLGRPVPLCGSWLDGVACDPGSAMLCENVRFNRGEGANEETLARKMAALCDVFVMDAFATAHRAQASTEGVARFAPAACAGPLLLAEVDALERALSAPARPLVAIVGGAKTSTKLGILQSLLDKVDRLIVGGGLANTFLAAVGARIGKSSCEREMLGSARDLIARAHGRGADIALPMDVTVAKEANAAAQARGVWLSQVEPDDLILDIGPATAAHFGRILACAKTIIWNGPVGMFEIEPFGAGTRAIAQAVAQSGAYSLVGGGETAAAIEQYGVADRISYVSTGGGAFLEFLEGKSLPALAVLERRARE
ncbi:MAG TPA: phosphoglycerate kinase [Steroidobacteraceae bacterium]|nr:phosphoglycerate kinase [Steroidobacteraceae bacterium]